MVTAHPASHLLPPGAGSAALRSPLREVQMLGAWRYAMPDSARTRFIVAALLSVGFHVAVFFGVGRHQPVVRAVVEDRPVVQMVIPIMKELEEPEPVMTDEPPPVDKASYAPSLMDIPNRIALPTDFVQQIDFASLIPPPDMEGAKVFVIPSNIARGAVATGIGNIFSLAELDRIPEPIVQPAPLFPPTLKREVESAKVTVEFIVDRDGKVLNPVVVQSTHEGFNEAAVVGVSRWRFRPGMKGGKKVNTRMSVPILFRIVTDEP